MSIPESVFSQLSSELPVVVARSEAPRLLGGLVSAGTLANEDAAGTGPRGMFYVGRRAAYPREGLVEWLRSRATATKKARVQGKAA
ncbi:MAG: hypothetical protein CXZ00_16345 [Acidobacteria bacterium]|nr:MAG: hypothetical protein CXZ00_16345 [Acidobacteriota bacterium]